NAYHRQNYWPQWLEGEQTLTFTGVRLVYSPIVEHDYTVDAPSFREIAPGHFVHCNDAEEKKYREQVK
ncbi:MAG: hypothetical protein IIX93_11375, partial [Clostridia bacterium]|nr:hypothetical protein [Clostridia bacterium]